MITVYKSESASTVEQLFLKHNLEMNFGYYVKTRAKNQVSIYRLGSSYIIKVICDNKEYTIRQDDYNKALKILEVMLEVIEQD